MNYFRLFLFVSFLSIIPAAYGMERIELFSTPISPPMNGQQAQKYFKVRLGNDSRSIACPFCNKKCVKQQSRPASALKFALLSHMKTHQLSDQQREIFNNSLNLALDITPKKRKRAVRPKPTKRQSKRRRRTNKTTSQETFRKMIGIEASVKENTVTCRALLHYILDNNILSIIAKNGKLNIGISKLIKAQIDCIYNTNLCRALLQRIFGNHLTDLN